jgi:hypothetical protein
MDLVERRYAPNKGLPASGSDAAIGSALNSKRIAESMVEFSQLLCRERTNKMGELLLEHQGQKVTTNSAFSRQTLTDAQHHLAAKTQNLAVGGSTDNRGDILVFSDEVARNNDIESRACTLVSGLSRSCDKSRLVSRFRLLLDQFKGLPVKSFAVPPKDFSFPVLFCQAFESRHKLLGSLPDDLRPAPKSSIRIRFQAIDSLQCTFIDSNHNSFHIRLVAECLQYWQWKFCDGLSNTDHK